MTQPSPFMKLEEPVHFGGGNPEKDAKLFFVLASKDHDMHMKNMEKLANMLLTADIMDALMNVKMRKNSLRWMTSILHDMRNLFFCNWVEAKEHIQNSEGILITLGSVEEHGCHLPLGTDTILAEAIAKELCQREDMYYYPCTTYGQVWSARDFESTISITPDCLGEYCIQAVRSVMRAHPRRIFLFSFHNGNHKVIEEVQRRLVDEGERETVFHIKLAGMEKKAADILTTPMWNGKVWHAGELETSPDAARGRGFGPHGESHCGVSAGSRLLWTKADPVEKLFKERSLRGCGSSHTREG